MEPTINKLKKMGLAEEAISNFTTSLFEGLNNQIYNTPIDLFIENFLYNEFPELRPYQFLSNYGMMQEGIKAVTDSKIVDLFPKDIVSKSKVYNLVNAKQFNDLYGFNFVKDLNANPRELKLATDFYEEFLQYRDDKEPGEEYELIIHWAEDLNLDKNFELVDEQTFLNKRVDVDNLLKSIENDPYDMESTDLDKERKMEKFLKTHKGKGENMAVVMYMVDALQFFDSKPKEDIKEIAFEIATLGTQGFSPEKENYKVGSIPGKNFTGYHILAYYYVSWALAMPQVVGELGLSFEKEFEMALTLWKA